MCGHGMIGVAATLAFLGRIEPGEHFIETPVGAVKVDLQTNSRVTARNVPSYRHGARVTVDVPGYGAVTGDVAWGGNWFFLVRGHGFVLNLDQVEALTTFTWEIRQALTAAGITGTDGSELDHIELFTDAHDPTNASRNFVLCPGKAYDLSPCGTGTSAKMACLADNGLLPQGKVWRQEGILGTVFEGSYQFDESEIDANENGNNAGNGKRIVPTITGSAHVTAECTLIFDPADPFRLGVPA